MRNRQELGRKIVELVELLSEMGELEIRAEIGFDEGLPGFDEPRLLVHLTGRDTPLLTANNGRVLDAIESLSLDMLGLFGAERECIRFDAGNFLADQRVRLRQIARLAIKHVEYTGTPHVFAPMSPRDRRLLGDALHPSGLNYETLGQHTAQWVILFPKEMTGPSESPEAQHSGLN
jgi:predicted RNA-binding protein Jag